MGTSVLATVDRPVSAWRSPIELTEHRLSDRRRDDVLSEVVPADERLAVVAGPQGQDPGQRSKRRLRPAANVVRVGTRQQFIAEQAEALPTLEFVVVTVLSDPLGAIELSRDEDGRFRVRAASPKRPFSSDQRTALAQLGLTEGEDTWDSATLTDAPSGAGLVERALTEVFGVGEVAAVNVDHGSRRPLVEAERKLQAIRTRVGPILAEVVGAPPTVDADGDFVLKMGTVEVYVSPLALPDMPPVVRVFAITNVGVTITPELGLFLARVNFGLMFGRFALDTDHRAVWFSETLLGEAFSDEELRFTIMMVAETADEWDDRIAQMFGGFTRATMPEEEQPAPTKPGQPGAAERGGYL